jgi:hypothetical protein
VPLLKQHDRDDAPGDSGHRHHGANAMADQSANGLDEDFFDYHYIEVAKIEWRQPLGRRWVVNRLW